MTTGTTPAARRVSLPLASHQPAPYDGPSRDEVLALRKQYLTPGLITYYREPLLVVEGHMQYLWDETGKQYLDGFAGIVTVSVGHCHPKVVEKVREQVGKLQHTTTIYLHPTVGAVRARSWPSTCRRAAGCRSATSPTRAARPTRSPSCRPASSPATHDVISLRNGYHGGTQAAMGLTRARHLEVQEQPGDQRQARDARLLLPLPLRPGVPELRRQVCPRRRGR